MHRESNLPLAARNSVASEAAPEYLVYVLEVRSLFKGSRLGRVFVVGRFSYCRGLGEVLLMLQLLITAATACIFFVDVALPISRMTIHTASCVLSHVRCLGCFARAKSTLPAVLTFLHLREGVTASHAVAAIVESCTNLHVLAAALPVLKGCYRCGLRPSPCTNTYN